MNAHPDAPLNLLTDPALRGTFGLDLDDDSWLLRLKSLTKDPDGEALGRLGPFELLKEAGRGGQGIVYEALDPRTRRKVAIKRLSAGAFATPEMRARFEREIEAAAALNHPGIVTVYGSEIVDGQPLLTMQCIEGVPFDRWASGANGSARGIREILLAFKDACDAVHHAHQRGVIHRDLKPSNILVDAEDRPHVLDFGLAYLRAEVLAPESSDPRSLTLTGEFVGTLTYAAPEQLGEDRRTVDVRTDVYALGAVLYRALTGRPPFAADGDVVRLIASIRDAAPARPSSLRDDVSGELELIVLKALAKDREQRYAGVRDLAEDIERLLLGQPVKAYPPSTWYLARKTLTRHKLLSGSLAVIFLLSLAFGVVSTGLSGKLRAERNAARLAQQRESRLLQAETELRQLADTRLEEATESHRLADLETERARRILNFMRGFIGNAEYEEGTEPGLTVVEMLDRAAAHLDNGAAKDDPLVEAPLRASLAAAYTRLGYSTKVAAQYELALRLQEATLGPDDPEIAGTLTGLAMAISGDPQRTEGLLKRALDIQTRTYGKESLPVARIYQQMALNLRESDRHDEGVALAYKALDLCLQLKATDDLLIAGAWRCVGWMLRGSRDAASLEASTQAFQKCLDLRVPRLGEHHLAVVDVRFQIARNLRDMGRICEAVPYFEGVLVDRSGHFDADHPYVQHVASELAALQFAAGHFDEAAKLWRGVLAAYHLRHASPADRLETARLAAKASLYGGDYDAAMVILDQEVESVRAAYGEASIEFIDLYLVSGQAAALAGRREDAMTRFRLAQGAIQQIEPQKVDLEAKGFPTLLDRQALMLMQLSDYDALEELLRSSEAQSILTGESDLFRTRLQIARADVLMHRGDFEEAQALLLAAYDYYFPRHWEQYWYRTVLDLCIELYELQGLPDRAEVWHQRRRVPGGDQYRCP